MLPHSFKARSGEPCQLRALANADADALGCFFAGLSAQTRCRFGPHPLTREYAVQLCRERCNDLAERFVVTHDGAIVGYFIVDFSPAPHEQARYLDLGVALDAAADPRLAPCMADAWQNKGIASPALQRLIALYQQRGVRSLVLMSGTQLSNQRARHFYRKAGFVELGEFQTEVANIDMWLPFRAD